MGFVYDLANLRQRRFGMRGHREIGNARQALRIDADRYVSQQVQIVFASILTLFPASTSCWIQIDCRATCSPYDSTQPS